MNELRVVVEAHHVDPTPGNPAKFAATVEKLEGPCAEKLGDRKQFARWCETRDGAVLRAKQAVFFALAVVLGTSQSGLDAPDVVRFVVSDCPDC